MENKMSQKEALTSAASYVTAGTATVVGFTFNEWLTLGGLFFVAATFVVNSIYKHLHYKLAKKDSNV